MSKVAAKPGGDAPRFAQCSSLVAARWRLALGPLEAPLSAAMPASKTNDGADASPFTHQIERLVDLLEPHVVRDQVIHLDLPGHVAVDVSRQLAASLDPAEGAAPPDSPRYQLEGPCSDLLAGGGHPYDHRLSPALVTTLQRRAHQIDVADRFEG